MCIGRLSTALVVLHFVFCFLFSSSSSFIVGLFCSGGMWTIAHPSSAEPSWRPSIRMRDQNQQSPIHFCLCRDIYHSDVIEISIHPVCVVSPLYRLWVFHFLFPKKKMTALVENRLKFRWEPKTFLAKKNVDKITWKRFRFFYIFSFPFISPSVAFCFFYGLAGLPSTKTLVYFWSD